MSDFEFFGGGDVSESYDPAAVERFKERIKQNAQFIAALQQQEKKQKGKDDALFQILLKWIKKNQNRGIMLLVAKLIEFNVPAGFILALLLLGNEELQREAGMDLLQLPEGDGQSRLLFESEPQSRGPDGQAPQEAVLSAIDLHGGDSTLPLRARAEINAWGKNMYQAASDFPFRILETTLDVQGNIKKVVVDLAANLLSDFLQHSSVEMEYEQARLLFESEPQSRGPDGQAFSFAQFMLQGILTQVKKDMEKRQLQA